MKNPLRTKSTLEKTVEELEKTAEDHPRGLKSGLAAIGILAVLLISAAVVRALNGHDEETD